MSKRLSLLLLISFVTIGSALAQHKIGSGQISGEFGFNGMYYIPDSTIGAEKVDSKVRANTYLNLMYTNGGFTVGAQYEFYSFPLIDFENIGYKGQGLTRYYADYKNDFIQVTAGTFYEQFGNGFALRAYEDRQLGIDNSLLGARVKITPYRGILIKGVWGLERKNFDFKYTDRHDFVRGIDLDLAFADMFPVIGEKGFVATIGGSFVSKYEKQPDYPLYVTSTYDSITETTTEYSIPTTSFPANVAVWSTRLQFGYKGFRLEGEYAQKSQDPCASNNYIFKKGNALFLSATYSMKGLGVSASFIRSDNMDFRSQRAVKENSLLCVNYIPAINRQYAYQLIGNYSYASQANGQIGVQAQVNYQIPKKTKLGGKYGVDITFNFSLFHNLDTTHVEAAQELGTVTGTDGYTSKFFKFGKERLYQDIGLEISHRFDKRWKLILAYNYIVYNMEQLQGHEGTLHGHLLASDLTCKINSKHALRLELQHLYAKEDYGSWIYGMLEYSINPHWFISVGDQWNYGNVLENQRLHYYNISAAYVWNTTRIALNFGKTREGILCVGGVCRAVPASYGLGLSITTSF